MPTWFDWLVVIVSPIATIFDLRVDPEGVVISRPMPTLVAAGFSTFIPTETELYLEASAPVLFNWAAPAFVS